MSTELTYSEVVELLPAYVLGILEPGEILAVDKYVQSYPELQTRLYEFEETVGQLAHAAPDVEPPVSMKQNILTHARADLVAQPATHLTSPTPPSPREPLDRPSVHWQPDKPAARSAPAEGWFAGWRRWGLAVGGALMVLLVIGLYIRQVQVQLNQVKEQLQKVQVAVVGLEQQVKDNQNGDQLESIRNTIVQLEQQVKDNQNLLDQIAAADPVVQIQLEEAAAQLETIQDTVKQLEQEVKDNQRVLELVASADLRVPLARTDLLTTEVELEAKATFHQSGDKGVLVVRGLEPLSPEQVYQLWVVVDGQPTPVPDGLLQGTEQGAPDFLVVSVPPEMQDFTIVDVSVEPAGGSQKITKEAVVLRGSVN